MLSFNKLNFIEKNQPLSFLWLFIKHYFFWIFLFEINRFVFIFYNREEWQEISLGEVLLSFIYSLKLDVSMSSYFMAIPFFLFLFYSLLRKDFLMTINKWYHYVLIVVTNLLYASELPIYDEWHTKLTKKAILYLQHPTEVINSATNNEIFGGLFLVFLLSSLLIWFYRKYIAPPVSLQKIYWTIPILGLLFIPFFIVIGIRGGLQQIPIQQSEVYYSTSTFLNFATVNTPWNLAQSIIENRYDDGKNPYQRMDPAIAKKLVADLYRVEKDTFPRILTIQKPNVMLIMLESFSADLLKTFGGYDSIAPNLEAMAQQGIAFTDLYSSGTLSDQGHCSILSAFPSQPCTVIIRQPDKAQKLPSIVKHFNKNDYYTSYYFGGQLIYGNIKAYVYLNKYDKVTEGKDFDQTLPEGKLGFHDQFLFDRVLKETNALKEPFFTTAFTMSSHSPYDYPGGKKYISWGGNENLYLNGVHYSDSCIGNFIKEAKKQPWFNNTLFIFCADHGDVTPKHHDFFNPQSRKVVSFLYGNVIKPEYRGMKIDKMGNQNDLANTVLSQLGGDVKPFVWSKNLLNPYTKDFAYSTDDYVNFFLDKGGAFTYRYTDDLYIYKNFKSPKDSARLVSNGSAYIQVLYQQYLDY
jgi:phosphoglycerol transferase MdoB-like AlkP superfamily enzyme